MEKKFPSSEKLTFGIYLGDIPEIEPSAKANPSKNTNSELTFGFDYLNDLESSVEEKESKFSPNSSHSSEDLPKELKSHLGPYWRNVPYSESSRRAAKNLKK